MFDSSFEYSLNSDINKLQANMVEILILSSETIFPCP